MAKATTRRKYLIWELKVSESEPMAIMAGSMAVGRNGVGIVS